MLNTLDTVIAFAVIMTVLSLLITILVQMVSTALSLRGKNLANALALTFQTIDPQIGEDAHSLAAQILRDPIFSDSILRTKNRPPVVPGKKAQGIIDLEREVRTAEAQLAADPKNPEKQKALDAVKKKLLETKSTLIKAQEELEKAMQELAANPKNHDKQTAVSSAEAELARAKADLEIPRVTPNRMKPWGVFSKLRDAFALGSAIRPGEVYRLLHEITNFTETEAAAHDIPSDLVEKAVHLLACLNVPDQPAKESREKLEAIQKLADTFSTPAQQKAVIDSLANFGATVERATTEAYDRFQRCFGSAQDRAEQWFQTHVRFVTIVCSVCAAFILQLDTAEIYRKLGDQPRLVEALVKAAPAAVEKGGEIVQSSDTPAYETYLLWLGKYPQFWLEQLPADGSADSYRQAITARLQEAVQKGEIKPEEIALSLEDYDKLQKDGTKQFLNKRKETVERLRQTLDEGGFDIVPRGLFRWGKDIPPGWAQRFRLPGPVAIFFVHLLGILATAGLLSLGAPFWFNLLKNLTSLRPALASLIEKRPSSAPALPPAPSSPLSPS
jgi:hypothetical protein